MNKLQQWFKEEYISYYLQFNDSRLIKHYIFTEKGFSAWESERKPRWDYCYSSLSISSYHYDAFWSPSKEIIQEYIEAHDGYYSLSKEGIIDSGTFKLFGKEYQSGFTALLSSPKLNYQEEQNRRVKLHPLPHLWSSMFSWGFSSLDSCR